MFIYNRYIYFASLNLHCVPAADWWLPAGVVYCWGCASYGRLGLESPQLAELPRDEDEEQYAPTPLPILTLPPIVAIGSGILHSLAVSEDGKLYSWGCASFGCLGLGRDSIAQMHKYEDDEVNLTNSN